MGLTMTASVLERDVEVAVEVPAGKVVALLGPNGAGKSTVLQAVAGLLRPDRGEAVLDDRVLFRIGAGGAEVWVPPHAREVAMLAQEPLLFPHLSALDNVAFGPRSAGMGRARSREVAERLLAEVEASDLAGRKPGRLSGGQAQRVAVARALAAEPRLLLLDEPMAALDVGVAPALRQMLRRVLTGRTAVVVTHDVLDALLLADEVAVVEAGRVVERGATAQVLSRPRSGFAARVAGLNMVRGTVEDGAVRDGLGRVVAGHPDPLLPHGAPAVAVFRPSAVSVFQQPPGGSPRNVLAVTVTELEPLGDRIRVRAGDLGADLTAAAVAELGLAPGARVCFVVKASEVDLYPA